MLRKALKISKTVVKAFSLTVFLSGAFYARGEDSISMPSSPAMPSVSVPQISNSFYIPGNSDFYSGRQSASSAANSSAQTANQSQYKNTQTAKDTIYNGVNNALSSSLADSLTESENPLINSSQILNSLSGILSGKTNINGADQLFTTTAQTLAQAAKTAQNDSLIQASQSSGQDSASPSILRFLINGTDMIPFCKTVFFSSAETDGSFLLTGDCRYEVNGSKRDETFYLLFHSKGSKNAIQEFSVEASVFQEVEDSSTYLYALTKTGNLTAQKTGNLISLKSKENGTVLNMLLSF